jgi:hypothetical protein
VPLHVVRNSGGLDLVTALRISGTALNADDGWKLQFYNDTATQEQGSLIVQYKTVGSWKTSLTSTNNVTFDTAGTERMRIDSSGNVGIGTSSPAGTLQLKDTNAKLQLTNDDNTGIAEVAFRTTTGSNKGFVQYNFSDNNMSFRTNSNEAMRIDSSGNLLVGKTSTSSNTVGTGVFPSGLATFCRDGAEVVYVNRKTSDGELIRLAKNGTTVGSIGVTAGGVDTYIGKGTTGLRFYDGSNTDGGTGIIVPWNTSTNAARDAQMNLGSSSERYRNLYLSGGVYLGGTGSANKLDDYEEGTWTPTFKQTVTNPTVTYSNTSGFYTKIGRMVHASCRIQTSTVSGGSGNLLLDGLPFAASNASGTKDMFTVSLGVVFNFSSGNAPSTGFISPSESRIKLFKADSAEARDSVYTAVTSVGASNGLIMNVVYMTDS